jgi:thiamine phosphate synthase YjbQ (UPF0047 family)
MQFISDIMQVETTGDTDILDITPMVTDIVRRSRVTTGICFLFIPGSTGALGTIEFEMGVVQDLKDAIDLNVPISEGCLMLGTWQQNVLLDFDNHPRMRRIIVHILRE